MDRKLKEMGEEFDNLFTRSVDNVKADRINDQKKRIRQISEPSEEPCSSDEDEQVDVDDGSNHAI